MEASHGEPRWFGGRVEDDGVVKTALLFPGQGSQYVGMGRDLVERFDEARACFEEADAILDYPLSRVCFHGPEEELRATRNTQPAILVHSVAVLRCLRALTPIQFAGAAGHSLGEYTAYVAAGTIRFEDALPLVRRRGDLMFQAGTDRPGTMAAVLGMEADRLEQVLAEIPGIVVPANLNCPGQIVVSGEVAAVEEAMRRCKGAGAKRVKRLEVSGAFHSPLMEGAAKGLSEALDRIEIGDPLSPVWANASAAPEEGIEAIRRSLEQQLLSPVRWEETIRSMRSDGFDRFLEIGPGRVLSGLARKIDSEAVGLPIGSPDEIDAFVTGERR